MPDKYPAIYNHLKTFKEKLEKRTDQGNNWFNLRSCDYYNEFEKPKIMWQWTSKEPSFVWDVAGMYAPNNVFIMTHASKYILALLNSRLITWYFEKISPKVRGGTLIFAKAYIEPIPLVEAPKNIQQIFEILTDYILYINSDKDIREKFKDTIEFFDRQIADSLVYELYFKEKFHEDGLYSEPREYLLELVSKNLKSINYDRWAELYWKKQLENDLIVEEEKELEKLEKENISIIKEVYNSLINDSEILEQIEKIKSHEWVKVIEGRQ